MLTSIPSPGPRVLLSVLAFLALPLLAACGEAAADEGGVAKLLQADRARAKAVAGKKIDKAVVHYASDAQVFMPNWPPAIGKAAVTELLNGQGSQKGFRMAEQPSDASVSSSGELGYTTGAFILNKQVEDSAGRWKRVEYSGNYVSVWRKTDEGGWELTHQSATYRPDWAS